MINRKRAAKIPYEEMWRRCAEETMYTDLVPIGQWFKAMDGKAACSECAYHWEYDFDDRLAVRPRFCPYCGADMREEIGVIK